MNRRKFLKVSGIGVCGLIALDGVFRATARVAPTGTARLNVLWISCEDTSPDLGCYGDEYATTPNLDRLAGQGCRYTRAFVPYPVCAPTRSAVITGMYPSTLGTMHMRTSMKGYEAVPPPAVKCFTEYLRAAGYYCTNNSKTDYQFKPPFTAWDESSKKAHWRNRPEGAPFFSVINLTVSHESRCWPKKNEKLVHEPAKAPVPPYYPDTPVVRRNIARYYDNIGKMDAQAGRILQDLTDDGLDDNTVVVFWGDHGRGLPRHKRWCYDSGIHVPLIVRWPGRIKGASVCGDLVSLIDLAPSVMSIAGVDIPTHMQGKAFLGPAKSAPREFIIAGRERMDLNSDDHIRCIRDKRYKYIRNFMPEKPYAQPIPYRDKMPIMQEWRRLDAAGQLKGPAKLFMRKTKPPEEFYDTDSDPYEINNLIDSARHETIIADMRQKLDRWIRRTGDLGQITEDELIERMWPGRKQPVTAEPTISFAEGPNGQLLVTIECTTQGASIGYRIDDETSWRLYSRPFTIRKGRKIQAKAIRIGYKESKPALQTS